MIAICGLLVFQGLGILHFSIALADAASEKERAEIINAWADVAGVASTAWRAELSETKAYDRTAAINRRKALSTLLSIRPMSSHDWLSLAGVQLATDEPMERVLDSLRLSMLTGANEGHVMGERGVIGASLWDRLPPDLKRWVAMDLAAGHIVARERLQATLAAEPERVRDELRAAMLTTGISPEEVRRRLGY
jgi:hypothetical protein